MLIEFTVENFRSIKEPATFSMVATKDKKLDGNLIKNVLNGDSLLKTGVIYGANASGKSNVLLALALLKAFVTNSHTYQKGMILQFFPFKIDKRCRSKPTKIRIAFLKEKIQYEYTLSFNEKRIIDESLSHCPNNKKAIIFQRINTDNYKFNIDKKEQKLISKRTLPNQLYLSKATQDNYKKTTQAFEWLNNDMPIIMATDHPVLENFTVDLWKKNKESKKHILKALLEADVGIDDISATSKNVSVQGEKYEIQTTHKGVVFDFQNEESEGTKRIFSLIGLWIVSLREGKTLLVDELDTKLHAHLNRFLVELFHDPTQNKKNAQLIFTTHNTTLLDQDLFRRDQIWFTEKNAETGSTDLYSLVEYKPRTDKDIEKGYLLGKYGALPFIKGEGIF